MDDMIIELSKYRLEKAENDFYIASKDDAEKQLYNARIFIEVMSIYVEDKIKEETIK